MFFKGAVIAAAVLAGSAGAWAEAPASQPATQPDASAIAALVAQMGSPKFQDRKHAQKELVQIGPAAEPALRDAMAHSSSDEIRSRAKAALDKIEDSLPDTPTRVSVKAVNEDPARVLQSLEDQAGISIGRGFAQAWNPNTSDSITLDLDRVPLLVALEKFCTATHSRPQTNFGMNAAQLELTPGDAGIWDQEDRIAIIANQISHSRIIQLGSKEVTRSDFIELTILTDPRLRLDEAQPPTVRVAEDENGASLLADANPNGNYFGAMNRSHWGFTTQIPLVFPPHVGKTLARFEGDLKMQVITKSVTLKIPDLTKAVGAAGIMAGNRKLQVVSFDPNGNRYALHLHVTNTDPPNPIAVMVVGRPEGANLWEELHTAIIRDANGEILNFNGGGHWDNTEADMDGQLYGRFGPNQLKPPFSLTWEVVTETKDLIVPFKLHDLPLPPG